MITECSKLKAERATLDGEIENKSAYCLQCEEMCYVNS